MKNKKIIIIIAILVVLLGLTSRFLETKKNLNFFEKAILDTTVFSTKIVSAPFNYIKDKIKESKDQKDLYEKYVKLKNKVEKTDLYYSQISELQEEIAELKSVLELNSTLSEYTYVNATVINRNIGYWFNYLTIDKGSKNGIKKGDAVIVSSGLVGRIEKVSNFSSIVRLLTTNEISNKISVKINVNNEKKYGVLTSYDATKERYIIEGIDDTNNIKNGDIILTTGLTNYFPSGLVIGKVDKIVKDEYDLNSVVEIIPTVDFDDISFVTVLNREAK